MAKEKAKMPDKERLRKMVKTGARYASQPKKKKKKKKDFSYYIKKLQKSVKEHFSKERRSRQNLADRSIGRRLRQSKMTEEDIAKMGYAPKKKRKK